jgi:Flp pilus assembly protein TadG
MVEMAFVAPVLLLILLGIIEFGFKFAQFNEVRHTAREAARFAAVSEPDLDGDADFDENDVVQAVCDAFNLSGTGNVDLDLAQVTGDEIGDTAEITVTLHTTSLSGAPLISSFVPTSLSNVARFRLEQPAEWADTTVNGQC